MPFPLAIPALMAGASALAGLFGNRKQTAQTSSTQNQTTNSNWNNNSISRPEYDDTQLGIRDWLAQNYVNRASETPNFMAQYAGTGINNINEGANAQRRIIENLLRSRGLGRTSGASAALGNLETNRINQNVNFMNNLPMVQENFERTRLGDLGQFFASLPVANRVTSSGSQTGTTTGQSSGTQTMPGNMLGGAFDNAASSLAYFAGKGWFNKPNLLSSIQGGGGYQPDN